MRIIPYLGDEELEDIPSATIIIKSVPFENSYVPACLMNAPVDDYEIDLEELNALMDGLEIATKQIDLMINSLISPKRVADSDVTVFDYETEEFDDNDDYEEDEDE